MPSKKLVHHIGSADRAKSRMPGEPRAFYTVKQVAADLNVCAKTVRRRIADGGLRAHRIGGKQLRISLEDYRAFKAMCRD